MKSSRALRHSFPRSPHTLAIALGLAATFSLPFPPVALGDAGCVDYAQTFAWVGSAPTPEAAQDLDVWGSLAAVAVGTAGLRVFDVTDPTNPVALGAVDTPGFAEDVDVLGWYGYVADWTRGLRIVDLRTPSAPVLVGAFDTPGAAGGVVVWSGYAYVADGDGIQVIDVTTPSAPTFVGSVATPGFATAVALSGHYLFVADGNEGLQVVDVSTPSSPAIVGALDTPGSAEGITLFGGLVCIADGGAGIHLVDVSTPESPTLVGSVDTPGTATDVGTTGDLLVVADGGGIQIVDPSNPTQPELRANLESPGDAAGVFVSGHHAFIADGAEGLQVGYVSDFLPFVGEVQVQNYAYRVAANENYAFVGTYAPVHGPATLHGVDISDPEHPTILWTTYPGDVSAVAAAGNYIYIQSGGLLIMDVTVPDAPVVRGTLSGSGSDLEVVGSYVFIASGGLRIVDVTDPDLPVGISALTLPTSGRIKGLAVDGNVAYLAGGNTGLVYVVDVTDLATPNLIGQVDLGSPVLDVASAGDHCVAGTESGLYVVDVTDPSSPSVVGSLPTVGIAYTLAVRGQEAYTVSQARIHFVSFADPTNPVLIGSWEDVSLPYDVALTESYCLLARNFRLTLLRQQCPAASDVIPAEFPLESSSVGGLRLVGAPNPFRSDVLLSTVLPAEGPVSLEVYDPSGARVLQRDLGWHPAGPQEISFDGRAEDGAPLPRGLWLVRVRSGADEEGSVKLVKIR